MRDDGDFEAYTAARWSTLVRSLVLLGSPPRVAEDIALDALARCYLQWNRIQEADDIDVRVYRTLLECRDRSRIAWWSDEEPDDRASAAASGARLRQDLEKILDRLELGDRQTLVLRFVADLSESQVADVLGGLVSVRSDTIAGSLGEETFREVTESIEVRPPEIDAIRGRVRAHRRRRGIGVLTVSLGVLVLVGLGTWLGTRPAEQDTNLSIAPVQQRENPSAMTWFANGELHLDHVLITLPPVQQIAVISGGAVYGDKKEVVFVADDGSRTLLGGKVPGAALVASDEQGWVAWVDPAGGSPEVVVYDLTSRTTLARTALNGGAAESWPIAIDQDRVFFTTPAQDYEWQPLSGDPVPVAPDGLLDVSSATRVFQGSPETISIHQPVFDIAIDRLGKGAQLSGDGDYVLTRTADARSVYGAVHIYDTRSGDEITTGITTEEIAIAAELGPERTVTYIVVRAEDKPGADEFVRLSFSGPLELRTCSFDTATCVVDTKFPSTGSTPLLAR